MNSDSPKPVAWAFYNPDGRIRFIVESEERAKLWAKSHQGTVVPLVPQANADNEQTRQA